MHYAPRGAAPTVRWPTPVELVVGFVTDFFDTLGIGSFAPTTAIYKLRRMVPDELIPGTLNVGHTPAAIAESLIFVTAIVVDPLLLVSMVCSAALQAHGSARASSRGCRAARSRSLWASPCSSPASPSPRRILGDSPAAARR